MRHTQESIEKIRSFNRFYTNVIGLLDQHYLDSPFSLTEGRVLYEIVHNDDCTAKKIRANISIDEGYLSRIIDKFMRLGLIKKSPAPQDRRLQIIVTTEKGQKEFSKLNENSNESISQVIENLSPAECEELVDLMERIHELLKGKRNLQEKTP
jgi:DNA-binding MarR family transcriptional regulator